MVLRAFLRVRRLLRVLMETPFLPPARPLTYFSKDPDPHTLKVRVRMGPGKLAASVQVGLQIRHNGNCSGIGSPCASCVLTRRKQR